MNLSLFWLWYRFRMWLDDCARFLPKIPRRKPAPPKTRCPLCGEPTNILSALDTGDGWMIFWDCENGCGEGDAAEWFPFVFGWANSKDMRRAGIEVV